MDDYRDDRFDRSSQCVQEIIQLIALNSRHCNTFWRRELNGTAHGKILHKKVLKMKDLLLALHLHPTPSHAQTAWVWRQLFTETAQHRRLLLGWDPCPHRGPAFPLSLIP